MHHLFYVQHLVVALPEMSEMSMSVGNNLFCRISWLGRFIVEKNIMLGMVSMKTWETDKCRYWLHTATMAFLKWSQVNNKTRTLRIQGGIVCVLGERWCVLMTMTVMMMEAMTNTIVKSMYFPMSGTALEVEGISSTITSRKTVRDSRTEMERVIFSPGDREMDTKTDIQATFTLQVFMLSFKFLPLLLIISATHHTALTWIWAILPVQIFFGHHHILHFELCVNFGCWQKRWPQSV